MIKNPNFIETYQMKNLDWIDPVIDFFEKSDKKIKGRIGGPDNIEEDLKISTDLPLYENYFDDSIKKCIDTYLIELDNCLKQYLKKYKFVNESYRFHVHYPINMQRYLPKEGYFKWHFERSGPNIPGHSSGDRVLVYMTYLNDVIKLGGETEWYYQNYKVKPKRGLTVIWPTDFTHTHRGIPTVEEKKYIFTGWYVFDKRTNKNV